jgi:hypothetical protein
VPVWVSACFNFDGFVFLLLTLLAWLLCVAVFLPVAIMFLPVVGLMAFGSTVGVSLAVLLLSSLLDCCSFCRLFCLLFCLMWPASWLALFAAYSFGLQVFFFLWCGGACVLCCWLIRFLG